MKVKISIEYDIDVSHLDPKFVDIEDFAKEEAYRMFCEDYQNGEILPCDFATIVE